MKWKHLVENNFTKALDNVIMTDYLGWQFSYFWFLRFDIIVGEMCKKKTHTHKDHAHTCIENAEHLVIVGGEQVGSSLSPSISLGTSFFASLWIVSAIKKFE